MVAFPEDSFVVEPQIGSQDVLSSLKARLDSAVGSNLDCFADSPGGVVYEVLEGYITRASRRRAGQLRKEFFASNRTCKPKPDSLPSLPTYVHGDSQFQKAEAFTFQVVGHETAPPILEYRPFAIDRNGGRISALDLKTGSAFEGTHISHLELGGLTSIQQHNRRDSSQFMRTLDLVMMQNNYSTSTSHIGKVIIRPPLLSHGGKPWYLPFWEIVVCSKREAVLLDCAPFRTRRVFRGSAPGCMMWVLRAPFQTIGAFFVDALSGTQVEAFANDSFFDENERSSTKVLISAVGECIKDLRRVRKNQRSRIDAILVATTGHDIEQVLLDYKAKGDATRNSSRKARRRMKAERVSEKKLRRSARKLRKRW